MDNKKWGWLVGLIIVIALVIFAVKQNRTDDNVYSAVFLSNGQVYFGKVTKAQGDNVVVKDIYYLQVSQQKIQPEPEGQAQPPQVQLIKLGNEIHGPQDEMQINKDHVLFTEELKEDGKVVKAIRNFQQNPTPTPTATQ